MSCIVVKYLGPTNTKPARFKIGKGLKMHVAKTYCRSNYDNVREAVIDYCTEMGWAPCIMSHAVLSEDRDVFTSFDVCGGSLFYVAPRKVK